MWCAFAAVNSARHQNSWVRSFGWQSQRQSQSQSQRAGSFRCAGAKIGLTAFNPVRVEKARIRSFRRGAHVFSVEWLRIALSLSLSLAYLRFITFYARVLLSLSLVSRLSSLCPSRASRTISSRKMPIKPARFIAPRLRIGTTNTIVFHGSSRRCALCMCRIIGCARLIGDIRY